MTDKNDWENWSKKDQNDIERRRMIMQESLDNSKPQTLDELCDFITEKVKIIYKLSSASFPFKSKTLREQIEKIVREELLGAQDVIGRGSE